MRLIPMSVGVFVIAGLCAGAASVRAQAPAGPMTQTTAPAAASTAPSGQAQSAPNVAHEKLSGIVEAE